MIAIMLEEILEVSNLCYSPVNCEKGALLFCRGDFVESVYVLQIGQIALTRNTDDGTEFVLSRGVGPCFLAEASVYSEKYHCDAMALSQCELLKFPKTEFVSLLVSNPSIAFSWASHLAKMLQSARQLSEIMRLNKVRDRVDAWLAFNNDEMPEKGQWKDWAAQIGVSSEALYRELSARGI